MKLRSHGSHGIKLWSLKPGCRPPAAGAGLFQRQLPRVLLSRAWVIPLLATISHGALKLHLCEVWRQAPPGVPAFGRLRQENWSSGPAWEDAISKQTVFFFLFKQQTTPTTFVVRVNVIFTRVMASVFLPCISCLCVQPIVLSMRHFPITFPT